MNTYAIGAVCAGLIVLLAAWLPEYLSDRPLSLPMVLVAIGAVTFSVLPGSVSLDPRDHLGLTEHLTELAVLISLLGAGLALDRPPGWSRWVECVASDRRDDADHHRSHVPGWVGRWSGSCNGPPLRRRARPHGSGPRC